MLLMIMIFTILLSSYFIGTYIKIDATDLTVGTTNAVTGIITDIDASSCDANNAFYQ